MRAFRKGVRRHRDEGADANPKSGSTLAQRVPAGLLDSACSSLASFIIGLVAVHYLPARALGAYALAFTAFLVVTTVPASLVLIPMEATAVRLVEGSARLRVLRHSIPAGLTVSGVASIIGALLTLAVPSNAPWHVRVSLAFGLVLLGTVSPVQDHVRRTLHAATVSWTAFRVSLIQLIAVVVLVGLSAAGGQIHQAWLPFAALAVANLVSSTYGVLSEHAFRLRPLAAGMLDIRDVVRTGGWLLAAQFGGAIVGFIMVAIIVADSGAAAGGYAEAARVLVQPPTVIIVGLMAVVAPEIQTATMLGQAGRVRKLQLVFTCGTLLVAAVWGLMIVPNWPHSPLDEWFPRAYVIPGLLALTIIGQTLGYANAIYNSMYLALNRTRPIATTAFIAMGIALLITVFASHGGALTLGWAAAIAETAQMAIMMGRNELMLRRIEREGIENVRDPSTVAPPDPALTNPEALGAYFNPVPASLTFESTPELERRREQRLREAELVAEHEVPAKRHRTTDRLRQRYLLALPFLASLFGPRDELRADRGEAEIRAGEHGWRIHCFLFLVVCSVVPSALRLGPLSFDAAFYILVVMVGGALVLTSSIPKGTWTDIALYVAFLAVALVSLAWAADFFVGVRTMVQLTAPAVVYVLARCLPDYQRFVRSASVAAACGVVAGSLLLFVPGLGNIVAPRPLAIALIPLFILASHGLASRWPVFALGLLALTSSVVSGARTSSALLILVIISSPAIRMKTRSRAGLVLVSLLLILLASNTATFKQRFFYSQNTTLIGVASGRQSGELNTSGRQNVWPLIEAVCDAKPTTGFGIGSSYAIASTVSNGAFSQPHNEYIRLKCDTGVVGETPALLFFIFALLRSLWAAYGDPEGRRLHVASVQLVACFFLLAITDNPLVYAGMFMAPLMLALAFSDSRMAELRSAPVRRWRRARQAALA